MNKKEQIIAKFLEGKKPNDIAREVGTYYGYVSTTIKQYKMEEALKTLQNK